MAKQNDKNTTTETETAPEKRTRRDFNPADLKKLFDNYKREGKAVEAAEVAVDKAMQSRSKVVLAILDMTGSNGPFNLDGERLMASTRTKKDGSVVAYFRGPGKTEAIEV